jgi:hypothetical protein
MSNMSAHLKKEDYIVLCADADGPNSAAWKTSERALEKLNQEGFKVSIIRPQGEKGRDFNDALQEEGIKAVQDQFKSFESQNSQTFRSSKNETFGIGPRESTKDTQVNTQETSHFSSTQEILNAGFDLRQKFEANNCGQIKGRNR